MTPPRMLAATRQGGEAVALWREHSRRWTVTVDGEVRAEADFEAGAWGAYRQLVKETGR